MGCKLHCGNNSLFPPGLLNCSPLFKGTPRASEMIVLQPDCFAACSHNPLPLALAWSKTRLGIDFQHDRMRSYADLLCSVTGKNDKKQKQKQKINPSKQNLFKAFGNGPKGKEQRRKCLVKK